MFISSDSKLQIEVNLNLHDAILRIKLHWHCFLGENYRFLY